MTYVDLFALLTMWLTPFFVLAITLILMMREGTLCLAGDLNRASSNWWVPNILLLLTIVGCASYWTVFKGTGWNAQWLGYGIFEYIGSWLVCGIFLFNSDKAYGVKQQHLNQNFLFNMNLDEVGPDKYLIRMVKDNFSKDNEQAMTLYRTIRQNDWTGEHIVAEREYTFPSKKSHEYTRAEIHRLLKNYFDNQRVFSVEKSAELIEVEKKAPEVIVIN